MGLATGALVTAPVDNRGAVALRQCGASYQQVAARIGASPLTVHNWTRGHRKPGPEWRKLLAKLYAIEPAWWDEPIKAKAAPSGGLLDVLPVVAQIDPSVEPTVSVGRASDGRGIAFTATLATTPVDPRSEAAALVSHIRQYRVQVETDPVLTLTEKAKILEIASRGVERLYRLTGEVAVIPEAKILASPSWARIKAALVAALEPHPEALRAVEAALAVVAEVS